MRPNAASTAALGPIWLVCPLRRRYPHIIAGAVAASAPVAQFPAVQDFNPSAFWDVVTKDATPAAGAAADCVDNTREAFKQLFEAGGSTEGRSMLQATFRLCEPLNSEEDAKRLAYWAQVCLQDTETVRYQV